MWRRNRCLPFSVEVRGVSLGGRVSLLRLAWFGVGLAAVQTDGQVIARWEDGYGVAEHFFIFNESWSSYMSNYLRRHDALMP